MEIKHKREADLVTHYDEQVEYYSPLDKNNVQWLFRQLAPSVPENAMLIDAGCGDGRLCPEWLTYRPRGSYVGIDYSRKRIDVARDRYRAGHFIVGDLNQCGVPRHPNCVTAMFEVLEHLEEPRAVLDRFADLGAVVGSVPIQMDYKAHLQVYQNPQDVEDRLGVDVLLSSDKHVFFRKG